MDFHLDIFSQIDQMINLVQKNNMNLDQDLDYHGQESCILTKIHKILAKNDEILNNIFSVMNLDQDSINLDHHSMTKIPLA